MRVRPRYSSDLRRRDPEPTARANDGVGLGQHEIINPRPQGAGCRFVQVEVGLRDVDRRARVRPDELPALVPGPDARVREDLEMPCDSAF